MPEKMAEVAPKPKKPERKIILTLNNCLLSPEKLTNTPSRNDGLDEETEMDLRIWGCELIQTAGILLRLPQVAMATGQVLFQRFYYCKSFARHAVETTAMACICLASKIEEAPRRIRDVINVFHHIKQIAEQKTIRPVILDQTYVNQKNLVIKAERRILKELGFCVHVKHPHKIIVMYLQVLSYEDNAQMMQLAWNYMNDSLRTDVFVRYEPEVIACACIYLTARKLHIPLPTDPAWFTVFGAQEDQIKSICITILRLYKRPKINIIELEQKVDEVRKVYQEKKLKERGKTLQVEEPSVKDSPKSPDGSHNAWGGFISRSGNHNVEKKSSPRRRSPVRKRSRSRRRSISKERRNKLRDRSRNRSRSPRKHKDHRRYRSDSYDKYQRTPEQKRYDYKSDYKSDYRSISKKDKYADENDKYHHDKYVREDSLERNDYHDSKGSSDSRSKSKKDRRR